ncbi:hypothetical protein CLU96_4813 [Chryseobacterium sp. 52]|uniref:hypothetical protein n=1 Tax=Chryseobacterium sp. 52 TaxID=2035213 RepID=UPI000C19DD65|nr:hypothetical protein [Chryseobacterium sp. 52]PIF47744.1 hypothetical protein CLU96_4813 [Chryseobacterium sp. 52]
MKKLFLLLISPFFLFCCKSQSNIRKKEAEKILDKTIIALSEKKGAISNHDFLILSSMKITDTAFYKNGKYGIGITIMNSKLTQGLKYKQVYSYKGYKVVSKDSLNLFKPFLSPIPYVDLNKSKLKEMNYDPFSVTIIFDKAGEVLYTFPEDYKKYYQEE